MSRSSRAVGAVAANRRTLAGLFAAAGALAAGALLSTGAEARSTATPANVSPPTISGMAIAGETLTASPGSWTGTAPLTFTFEWQRCDSAGASCAPIGGATGQTYTATNDDVGATLRANVTATNAEGSASALSTQTAVVAQPSAPVNAGEPLISGSPVEGSTLTATAGTWTGAGSITYAYQWVRCDAGGGLPDGSNCPTVPGATGSGYTLTADDIGRRLRVQVTATNSAGSTAAASNPTDVVTQSTATGPPRNIVEPSISGTPQQGFSLFADIGTWAGATPITFTYQWVRCGASGGNPDGSNCTFISSATTSSYLPTSDDVGQRLRLRVTATNSLGVQTVASNASAPVLGPTTAPLQAPRNTFPPSIAGTLAVGQTLFASLGSWTGTLPITYAYQWMRCGADGGTSSGVGCAAIAGAASSQYAPATPDVGQRLRVQVTARNSVGTATTLSNPSVQVLSTAPTPPTQPAPGSALPQGAVTLPGGKVSVPVTSVSSPERLIAAEIDFVPDTVRSRQRPIVLRVRVLDTRGYAVRDALVFARATPLVTTSSGEVRTGRDGWARLQLSPHATFPLDGRSVQFWIRVRKERDVLLAGVSNRRLVQVSTTAG
jgi:hypothetical protein